MAYKRKHYILKVNVGPFIGSLSRSILRIHVDGVDDAFAKPIAIYSNISLRLQPRNFTKKTDIPLRSQQPSQHPYH